MRLKIGSLEIHKPKNLVKLGRIRSAALRQADTHHTRKWILVVTLSAAFALSSVFHLFCSVYAQAQDRSGLVNGSSHQLKTGDSQTKIMSPPAPCSNVSPPSSGKCSSCTNDVPGASEYEKSLPVPTPHPGSDYMVQLVNESKGTILAAANAANQGGATPIAVVPYPLVTISRPFAFSRSTTWSVCGWQSSNCLSGWPPLSKLRAMVVAAFCTAGFRVSQHGSSSIVVAGCSSTSVMVCSFWSIVGDYGSGRQWFAMCPNFCRMMMFLRSDIGMMRPGQGDR